MALGDVKSGIASVLAAAYLDILPPAGEEWVIHNIYHADSVSIEFYDGTNSIIVDAITGRGVYAYYAFHCTNARRIRVKNTAAAAALIGYCGMQTK